MNFRKIMLLAFAGLLALSLAVPGLARNIEVEGNSPLLKPGQTGSNPQESILSINNQTIWVEKDGFFHWIDPFSGVNGTFPKGTAGTVFAQGLVWGGKVNDGGATTVRVNGSTYENGLTAGKVIFPAGAGPGDALPTGYENVSEQQVWRVRRNYETVDLTGDASQFYGKPVADVTDADISAIRDQYAHDWNMWPAAKGAPYEDVDDDGSYDPTVDIPGYPGADQTVWIVGHDMGGASAGTYGSPPIGMELQMTMWAYDFPSTSALGNIGFIRNRLIYTGLIDTIGGADVNATIDSMFVVHWVDPDVGDAGDDYAGSDTTLSLGYAYNGAVTDPTYLNNFGLPAPATGWDFLQGPIVDSGAGVDTLGMTSFTFFAAGSAIGDPDLGDYEGTLQWFNLMRGLLPRPAYPDGSPWVNPNTGEESKFTLSGDPVLGSGWIDGATLPPGDRRIVMSSGPFTMAVGDTQDVVVGQISALGTSNLSSVSLLKFYDTFAQFAYDSDFDLPIPPATPQVEAVELDGKVVLNWGEDEEAVTRTEDPISKGFRFEGYNVYQLPSATAQISEGVKVETFDILNNTSLIIEPVFDPASGFVVEKPTQQAPNTGIKRFIEIERDNVRSRPLANGVDYHFAVTAYSVLEGAGGDLPFRRLESSPAVLTVTPQPQKPNMVVNANQGDTLAVEQTSGTSDGVITPIVVDPTAVNGETYSVVFDTTAAGDVVWHLINETSGDTLFKNQANQSNDDDYPIVNGVQVKVSGPPPGFNNISEVAWSGDPVDSDGVWHSLNSTADYFVSAGGGSGGMDRIARYIDYAAPRDFEMRFTDAGGYGVYAFEDDKVATTPFELWDIGVATPDDPSDDVRMIPFLLSEAGTSDSWGYATGSSYYFSGYPISDWVYWMDPEGNDGYDNFAAQAAADGVGNTYDYANDGSTDGYWANFYGGFVYPIGRLVLGDFADDGTPPPAGTTIRLVTNKPNGKGDAFQFTTPAPVSQEQITEAEVEDINVFPNPYYGYQALETGRFNKFVTFTHLPETATIRIFNLAGIMVRKIDHDSEEQFVRWDLTNQDELPVASGIYIAHVETENGSKVLKLAIVQEQQILQRY